MATFKQIRGQLIKKYTTNPTNPLAGQMWYNNTTGTLKVYTMGVAAWASAPTLGTARYQLGGAGASNTSAGTISAQGDITSNASSDIALKENIVNIPNPLEKLAKIGG